ncbi:origin recognition complex subunit [Histoplasma capsulatum G186AR]|uniref:Origin recognition complex subunit n=1 Tax=Ajellomyces capsulatus TaxID=5037 RepID=A0A8H8CZA1_AJECA|nr:origin recognition complex subunit [Histoplasma capsulatum]QSS73636.1 origin recognition complex subunit [Histoplasma capsulatum G186AR]
MGWKIWTRMTRICLPYNYNRGLWTMTLTRSSLRNYRHMLTSSRHCVKKTNLRATPGLSQHLFSKSLRANSPSHSSALNPNIKRFINSSSRPLSREKATRYFSLVRGAAEKPLLWKPSFHLWQKTTEMTSMSCV